jgi:hypothetical protein
MNKGGVLGFAMVLVAFGCSSSSGPGRGITPGDILAAPMGSVEIDGQMVTMTGNYVVVADGSPLTVMGVLSDANASVDALWFLSGTVLESTESPDGCFVPGKSCSGYDTSVTYEAGREFVVALDVRNSNGGVHRVRSDWITLISAP